MRDQVILIDFIGFIDETFVHRIRNPGEAIHYEIGKTGHGSVTNDISATDQLRVCVTDRRYVGDVMTAIKKALAKHNLAEIARISRDST